MGPPNHQLSVVRLRNNLLSGQLPEGFWLLAQLYSVDLQNNE